MSTNSVHYHVRAMVLALIAVLALLFTGCSTDITASRGPIVAKTKEQYRNEAGQYLNLATSSEYPASFTQRLLAAENFIRAEELEEGGKILKNLLTEEPKMDPEFRKTIFEARLALLKQDSKRSLHLIKLMSNTVTRMHGESGRAINPNQNLNQKKIALLLPTRGPHAVAAKTIRDGFLAGYYNTLSSQSKMKEPRVQVYETDHGVAAAYQKALADKVDFIVGPLTKPEVQAIAGIPLSVPVLALNTIVKNDRLPNKLYQFGLMPEDEVRATALHARQQGHSRALIFAPQNEWGQRMINSFRANFENHQGKVVEIVWLNPTTNNNQELSNKISSALRSTGSDHRHDIDMIFLAVAKDMGRQIKPLLDLNNASNLAVYATAAIYSGTPSPVEDQDLNGVHFCDIPWVLSNSTAYSKTRQAMAHLWPKNFTEAPRYFALGMDAYNLSLQLAENAPKTSNMHGMTGELQIDSRHHIQRKLHCARFEQGIPVPE